MVQEQLCRETNDGSAAGKDLELWPFKTEKGVQRGQITSNNGWKSK